MGEIIRDVKSSTVYKKAFHVAMEIFEINEELRQGKISINGWKHSLKLY